MNDYFKKYLKYKKKYLNFTGGSVDDSMPVLSNYKVHFDTALKEALAKKDEAQSTIYNKLEKDLYYNLILTLLNNYYNSDRMIDSTVKKFILYIHTPDETEFTENDTNKTENDIKTIKDKALLNYLIPTNITNLNIFINENRINIFIILLDYIYKLLLSNYDIWHEIFNNGLSLHLPKKCTFKINPKPGCMFAMGTVMRRLGITIFHDYMTKLYFKSIYKSLQTSKYYILQIDDPEDLNSCFVYGLYDGNTSDLSALIITKTCEHVDGYTRFFILSDTHDFHDKVKLDFDKLHIDVLIHAGDLYYEQSRSHNKTLEGDNIKVFEWLKNTKIENKLVIPGNHDYVLEEYEISELKTQMKDEYKITYLNNEVITHKINDKEFSIYGHGFRQGSDDKVAKRNTTNNAFEHTREEIIKKVQTIEKNTTSLDIIITHGVACDLKDLKKYNKRATEKRCVDISSLITKFKPKICVSGDEHKEYFSSEQNDNNQNLEDVMTNSIKIYTYPDSEYGIFIHASVLNKYNAFAGLPVILDVKTEWLKPTVIPTYTI